VVADPEVDPPMNRAALAILLVVVLLPTAFVGLSLTASGTRAATPSSSGGLTANITGPTILSVGSNHRYPIHATGGPAVLPNGTLVGNLTYYASVSAPDLTGVTITPASAALLNGTPGQPLLEVGSIAQTLTINVLLSSVYNKSNASVNLTYTVHVVQPYVVAAEIVNLANVTVGSFPVLVALDGVQVGRDGPVHPAPRGLQPELQLRDLGLRVRVPHVHALARARPRARPLRERVDVVLRDDLHSGGGHGLHAVVRDGRGRVRRGALYIGCPAGRAPAQRPEEVARFRTVAPCSPRPT